MLLVFVRTMITFVIMFAVIRLMGKRQIGEMQPYEFVITLLIAELASIPMSDLSIPLLYGIVAVLAIFVFHQLFTILEKKSVFFGRIISSKPSIIIDSEGINFKEMRGLNITVNELQENLRNAGYSNFDEIEYALIETNGKFSILEKQKSENEKQPQKTPLPVCVIEEGKFKDWELNKIQLEKSLIEKILKEDGIKNLSDVEVATIDNNGKLYYQQKNQSYKVINFDFEGGKKW
ncbi:MAG: DUF421 domain-containing protein [Clostridia bacterium]|nr:DUF421 domain-containing protein [Clostridia bacterium]